MEKGQRTMPGIMLYIDQKEQLSILTVDEFREFVFMMMEYAGGKEPSTDNRILQTAFAGVKPRLDEDIRKYHRRKESSTVNINKRWEEERRKKENNEKKEDIF